MKKLIAKIISVNLAVFFLLNPGVVLAQIRDNSLDLEHNGAEISQKEAENGLKSSENIPTFSSTKKNCFEFVALSLVYLPRTTESLAHGCGDECSELSRRAAPQSHGRKSVVRGLPTELKESLAKECKKPAKKGKIAYNNEETTDIKDVLKTDVLAKTDIISKFVFSTPFDPIYRSAEAKYGVPWQVLSAVHEIETGRRGDTYIASYAGATGPMQFLPSTFAMYGVDGDGDGIANINDVDDAIFSAAHYLAASGAPSNINGALFAYNHDYWYVNSVLYRARSLGYAA